MHLSSRNSVSNENKTTLQRNGFFFKLYVPNLMIINSSLDPASSCRWMKGLLLPVEDIWYSQWTLGSVIPLSWQYLYCTSSQNTYSGGLGHSLKQWDIWHQGKDHLLFPLREPFWAKHCSGKALAHAKEARSNPVNRFPVAIVLLSDIHCAF